MNKERIFKTGTLVLVALAMITCLVGCGSNSPAPQDVTDPVGSILIGWPPQAEPTRTVSNDEIILGGSQFSEMGGEVVLDLPSTTIELSHGDFTTYTMYSLSGFGSGIDLGSVLVDYLVEDPVGEIGTTKLFFGISNYLEKSWDWYEGDPANPEIIFPNSLDLPSMDGNIHFVAVLVGEGRAILSSIAFRRLGDTTLYPPENLVADPDVNEILLTWDASQGAAGYNVYRNQLRGSDEYMKLNSEPILETTFLDDGVARNFMYFYRVTAVAHIESEMGNRVDIYSPQEDLYLPLNHQVSDSGTDFFRITWEWEGDSPDGWALFLKEEDDFDLYEPITIHGFGVPFIRSYKFSGLIPGRSYFWRICAVVNGKRGRMTDDLPGVTEGLWSWEPVEEIGSGLSPISALTVDDDISVAYINGSSGYFARRNDGDWSSEEALTALAGGMASVDMAYGGGKYVLVGLDGSPGDVIASTGNPGDWANIRIDGDGSMAPGHANSGTNAQVVANDTHFLTTYHDDETFELVYQETPIDTIDWTSKSVILPIFNGNSQYSLAAKSDNFHLLWYNYESGNEGLEFYSYDDAAWNMLDILPGGPSTIGHYNDLTMSSSGEWFSTAYDPSSFSMHFVQGTGAPWSTAAATGHDRQGDNATMAAVGDRMFSVFKNRDFSIWMLAIFDAGVWELSPLSLPGVDIRNAKLVDLAGTPYIVFHDQDGDIIKCAPGSPPPV